MQRAFIATAQAFDAEMRARIDRHVADCGAEFETFEEPLALRVRLANASADVVVVDCLTLWLSNQLLQQPEPSSAAREREAGHCDRGLNDADPVEAAGSVPNADDRARPLHEIADRIEFIEREVRARLFELMPPRSRSPSLTFVLDATNALTSSCRAGKTSHYASLARPILWDRLECAGGAVSCVGLYGNLEA